MRRQSNHARPGFSEIRRALTRKRDTMIAKTLKTFLDQQQVRYETIIHPPAFTAQEVAECTHITGKAMAKTVMVVIDGAPAMAVRGGADKAATVCLRRAANATSCHSTRSPM